MFQILIYSVTIAPPPPPTPTPLKKVTPFFLSKPPLKVEVLSSPPFLKFGWRLNPPLQTAEREGGAHYVTLTET